MPAWIPLIKVVLPYVAPIFAAALPAFTKKKSDRADPVVNQQIGELQEAVKTNAESIAALAKALEEAVKANDEAMQRTRQLAFAAMGMAAFSLALAVANAI
jgi:hypothetical protein